MTRVSALLALAAVLAAALVWQDWPTPVAPVPRSAVPSEPKPEPKAPTAPGLEGLALHPLFSPSRHAPAVVSAAVTPDESPPAPQLSPPPEVPAAPVLQGVILTPGPGAAYLALGGGPAQFLRPGEEAFGLRLLQVLPDAARFEGPGGEVTLPLSRPAAPPEPPSPEPPPSEASPAALPPDAFAPVQEEP